MEKKKNIYIVILFIFIICFFYIYNLYVKKQIITVVSQTETKKQPENIQKEEKIDIEKQKEINVSLNILDRNYNFLIKKGSTVYDLMNNLKEENQFSFKYREYPSLGIFIEEINGAKNEPGRYWIYYVNGKESSVGVSNYVLKSGDIISWKQE